MSEVYENQVQAEILLQVGSLPFVRLWRNNTGKARAMDNPNRIIQFGLPGSPDLLGFFDDGRFLGIEVKRPGGRQSKEQKAFETVLQRFNGIYILADNVADALDQVHAAYERRGQLKIPELVEHDQVDQVRKLQSERNHITRALYGLSYDDPSLTVDQVATCAANLRARADNATKKIGELVRLLGLALGYVHAINAESAALRKEMIEVLTAVRHG